MALKYKILLILIISLFCLSVVNARVSCPSYCEGGVHYYDGEYGVRSSECTYSTERCAAGCDARGASCAVVEISDGVEGAEEEPEVEDDATSITVDKKEIVPDVKRKEMSSVRVERREIVMPEVVPVVSEGNDEVDDLVVKEEKPKVVVKGVDADCEFDVSRCDAYCKRKDCIVAETAETEKDEVSEISKIMEEHDAESVEISREGDRPVYTVRKKVKKMFLGFIPYTVEEEVKVDPTSNVDMDMTSNWPVACLTSAVMFNFGRKDVAIDVGDYIVKTDESGGVTVLLEAGKYNYNFKIGDGAIYKEVNVGLENKFNLEPQYNYLFKGSLDLENPPPTCVVLVNLDFVDLSPHGGECDNCDLGCSDLGMLGLKKCGGQQLSPFYAKECSSGDDCKIDCSQLDGSCKENIGLLCSYSYGVTSKTFCVHGSQMNEEKAYLFSKHQALADEFCKAIEGSWDKPWPEARAVNVEKGGKWLDFECTYVMKAIFEFSPCSGQFCETVTPGFMYPKFHFNLYTQQFKYLGGSGPYPVYFPWDDPNVDVKLGDHDLSILMFVDVLNEFNSREPFWYYWI